MLNGTFWISVAPLLGWLWLLAWRGRFWRAEQRLADTDAFVPPAAWPSVAVVVPARNEADVIGTAVRSICGQDYPGTVEIVVVDDASTDGTGEAVPRAAGLRVVPGGERPPGWTGKLWAISRGLAAAPPADFVWLTDADIAHSPGELSALVAKAEAGGLDLVSLMVRLRLETFWDRLLVPAFVLVFCVINVA